MKVKLIGYTVPVENGSPVDIVEQAASMCYDSKPTKSHAIAKSCAKTGHMSVWEHISFVFEVQGVSRAMLAQITRHRHHSFSVRSQRYCNESNFDFVIPDAIKNWEDAHCRFEFYDTISHVRDVYKDLVDNGIKPEDARALLPNACETKFVISANARAWIESSHLRLCARAQKEIRDFYKMIRLEIEKVCPEVAEFMVPMCETRSVPYCAEHAGCGKYPSLEKLLEK